MLMLMLLHSTMRFKVKGKLCERRKLRVRNRYAIGFSNIPTGLKTGMYYLRTKPAVNAVQFTVDKEALKAKEEKDASVQNAARQVASMTVEEEGCLMCSG
ncbi:hypothetical protein Y032_0093g2680 [Ancylostoma ceylanicum]|uniref:Uncharacterized protein n=1 Tax=Ancylostoma ceylanicum TaxID=53326 RepID=A0A016TM56_9BILA|nr:hypothetical protein Y032_0093g2680 [Ancylostoma ceylanicum]